MHAHACDTHKGIPPRTRTRTHTHAFTHIPVTEYSGVRCLFCGRVFSWQSWVIRVSVRACLPVCVCCVCVCAVWFALSVGLLLLALSFYILFANCHHYRDYHRITGITFIKRTTSKCLVLRFIKFDDSRSHVAESTSVSGAAIYSGVIP